jgi:dUTPase
MLGKTAILSALSQGDISISYEYDLTGETPSRLTQAAPVDPIDANALGTRIFQQQFFGDRLGVTLGPIVVSDSIRKLSGRTLFKNRRNHFDLASSDGSIELMPGESLAVHSMEYIKLSGEIAAYILPRLTLATVGLTVVTTYIDPHWEGILQLYITNHSAHSHSLKLGERIAICRFYKVDGADDNPDIKSQFVQKSHHYGLNWRRILDTDSEVQPRRKRPVPAALYRERLRNAASQFFTKWNNILGLAAGAALIAAIYAFAMFENKAAEIDKISGQLQSVKTTADQTSTDQKATALLIPQSGTLDFQIGNGELESVQEITLERKSTDSANVWVGAETSDGPVQASGGVYCSPGESGCKLRVTVRRGPSHSGPVSGQVKWLILGR